MAKASDISLMQIFEKGLESLSGSIQDCKRRTRQFLTNLYTNERVVRNLMKQELKINSKSDDFRLQKIEAPKELDSVIESEFSST